MVSLKYLLKKEWSMGNGQCPDCCGVPIKWHGHPCYPTSKNIGHDKDCPLAISIKELGGTPLFKGQYKSKIVYESYITDAGMIAVRRQQPKKEEMK